MASRIQHPLSDIRSVIHTPLSPSMRHLVQSKGCAKMWSARDLLTGRPPMVFRRHYGLKAMTSDPAPSLPWVEPTAVLRFHQPPPMA